MPSSGDLGPPNKETVDPEQGDVMVRSVWSRGSGTAHQILFPAGLDETTLLTISGNDAEVHLVVQSHGKARGGKTLLDQLTFVETGCTSTCEDIQFAVHKPCWVALYRQISGMSRERCLIRPLRIEPLEGDAWALCGREVT